MKKLLLFLCSLVASAAMQAQIIHVPGDYPTIQQGINAANPGDTVLVAEGTYYEQINFLGKKPLIVASQFMIDGDTNHIANTIIDGSQLNDPDSASVVYFISGEDTTSILCGFTITEGRGTTNFDTIWGWARVGGGIWISGSGAKIRNNIIMRNRCEDFSIPDSSYTNSIGGGIATSNEQDTLWIVIEDNVIDSNFVISNKPLGGCTGGGIEVGNNCRIINNIIKNNEGKNLVNTTYWTQGVGAAILLPDASWNKTAIIHNNQFLNNKNNSNNAFGGGMKVAGVTLTCTNNQFIGNSLISSIGSTNAWGAGLEAGQLLPGSVISGNLFQDNYSVRAYAGMYIFPGSDTVLVENNYFFNNVAEINGGGCGINSHPAILQNNVFSGNQAGKRGGALYMYKSSTLDVIHLSTLINNSFSGNKSGNEGGAIYSINAKPLIINSVFWGDSAITGQEMYIFASDSAELAYSNINPDYIHGTVDDGGGNINEDPLFMDPVYLFPYNFSPVIDAGTSEFTCSHGFTFTAPAYQINGYARPVGAGWDMGAYDHEYWPVGIGRITNYELRITNYPNPVITSTIFEYSLQKSGHVKLQIYNCFGQLVDELVISIQATGEQQVQWNAGNLPAGMYYYRIESGGMAGSGKMVKIK